MVLNEDAAGPGRAYLLVRANVADPAEREGFDQWYGTHHLAFAKQAFKAEKAWRFWSRSEPAIHFALYEFADLAHLTERMGSPDLSVLLEDFGRTWPHVHLTRNLIEMVQSVP